MTDFARNLTIFVFGTATALTDMIKLGTGVVGLLGAVFMVFAGWNTWQIKKKELKIKTIELARLERDQKCTRAE